jgi:mannose-6-phosphate isomerase-like protein (cupin superfamily)
VLEDGTEETISEPGSVTVQRGTLHRWENRGKEWVRFVAVMIDAKPVEVEVDGTTKTLGDYFPPRPIGAHAASAPKAPGA